MALSSCISLSKQATPFNIDETGTHGTVEFPVAIYRDDITEDFVNWHWHAEIEIGHVEKGVILLECGNRKYILSEGDLFFINTNVLHSMRNHIPVNAAIFKSVIFDSSVISSNTESIYYKKYLHPIIHSASIRDFILKSDSIFFSKLDNIIKTVWEIINHEPEDYEISVRNELSDFFAVLNHMNLTESMLTHTVNPLLEERVQIILNYIHSNYSKNITLDDLANAANVSKSEVLRCFKSIINISPIKYLKNFRLQNAAYMLKSSTYSVQTIYELCGFDNNSYFSKSFKELFHCSPREYRNN
jgi:AraC-like DNA-binding protein